MNKAIIESIEWHKDQLFKLLEDGNFTKIEGEIYSVKNELNEIIEKAKSKKRVLVHGKSGTFYREQLVGKEKEEDVSVERLKTTASTLMSTEAKLKKDGKLDEAKKLRKEKIDPTLKRLYDLEEKTGYRSFKDK